MSPRATPGRPLRRRSSLLGRIAFGLRLWLGGVEELSGVLGGRLSSAIATMILSRIFIGLFTLV